MCKIAICDDDKEYREKIKTVIETEGILSSNEIRFYEYESGKELLEDADILHDLIFMDMRMPGLDGNKTVLKLREYNEAAILVFCSGCNMANADHMVCRSWRYIYHGAGRCQQQEVGCEREKSLWDAREGNFSY